MKIIRVDNFNRETVSDLLVCENISQHYGEIIVGLLNNKESNESPNFFKLVQDDYKLYNFQP